MAQSKIPQYYRVWLLGFHTLHVFVSHWGPCMVKEAKKQQQKKNKQFITNKDQYNTAVVMLVRVWAMGVKFFRGYFRLV